MKMAKNNKRRRALVIIPVFNEEKRLGKVIDGIKRQVLDVKVDILVVNDGSSDSSKKIAEEKKCLVIDHLKRQGYGESVKEGFDYALRHNYDYILKLDGDGQHDPFYISTIIKILLRGDVDYVISSRYLRKVDKIHKPPITRRLVNTMCTGAINSITKLDLSDVFCGIFGITKELLSKLDLQTKGYGLELEMILQSYFNKARFLEIPHPLIYTKESSKFLNVYGKNDIDTLGTRLEIYARIILNTLRRFCIEEI